MAVIDQVYVTHCALSDSLRDESGFTLRAASTEDPDLLQFALNYPGLELPLDSLGTDPHPDDAPRRLALVAAPGARRALLQTVYAGLDTSKRPGNYFTHVLYGADLPLREALQTWASPGWANAYRPGGGKKLPHFLREKLNAPGPIPLNRELLRRFLADPAFPADARLGLSLSPERLAGKPKERQRLLAMMLMGVLHALRGGPARRLSVLAEPGLAVALLYGAAELLPGRQVQALTFTTYEPQHRSFGTFQHAQIVCTYAKDGGRGLDGHAAGLALDTFQPERSSPEVASVDPLVATLVAWAGQNNWAALEALQSCHPGDAVSVESLRDARWVVNLFDQLSVSGVTEDDLLRLAGMAQGRAAAARNKAALFPAIAEHALTSAKVRAQFGWLLLELLPELRKRCGEALAQAKSAQAEAVEPAWDRWRRHWELMRTLRGQDAAASRRDFLDALHSAGSNGWPCALRTRLLGQWRELVPPDEAPPPAVEDLLTPATPAELVEINQANLPLPWKLLATLLALERPATCEAAVATLRGDGAMMQAFCPLVVRERPLPRAAELLLLVASEGDKLDLHWCEYLLSRGETIPVAARLPVLGALLKAGMGKISAFSQGKILIGWINWIKGTPAAAPVWNQLSQVVNQDLLFGDPDQAGVMRQLVLLRAAGTLPPELTNLADTWAVLQEAVENPGDPDGPDFKRIETAFRELAIDRRKFLRSYFAKQVAGQGDKERLAKFTHLFERCQPWRREGATVDALYSLTCHWFDTVGVCPDEKLRTTYQIYYLRRCPEARRTELYSRLAQRPEMTEDAAAWAGKHSEKAAAASVPGEIGPKRRRRLLWVVVPLIALGIGAGVYFLPPLFSGGNNDPQPQPPPKTVQKQEKDDRSAKPPPEKPAGLGPEAVSHLREIIEHLTGDALINRELLARVGGDGARRTLDARLTKLQELLEELAQNKPGDRTKDLAELSRSLRSLADAVAEKWKAVPEPKLEGTRTRLLIELWHYCLDGTAKDKWQHEQEQVLLDDNINRVRAAEAKVVVADEKKATASDIGKAQTLKKELLRQVASLQKWKKLLSNAEDAIRQRPNLRDSLLKPRARILDTLIDFIAAERQLRRDAPAEALNPAEVRARVERLEKDLAGPMADVGKLLK